MLDFIKQEYLLSSIILYIDIRFLVHKSLFSFFWDGGYPLARDVLLAVCVGGHTDLLYMGDSFAYYTLMTELPTYMANIQHSDITKIRLLLSH